MNRPYQSIYHPPPSTPSLNQPNPLPPSPLLSGMLVDTAGLVNEPLSKGQVGAPPTPLPVCVAGLYVSTHSRQCLPSLTSIPSHTSVSSLLLIPPSFPSFSSLLLILPSFPSLSHLHLIPRLAYGSVCGLTRVRPRHFQRRPISAQELSLVVHHQQHANDATQHVLGVSQLVFQPLEA